MGKNTLKRKCRGKMYNGYTIGTYIHNNRDRIVVNLIVDNIDV